MAGLATAGYCEGRAAPWLHCRTIFSGRCSMPRLQQRCPPFACPPGCPTSRQGGPSWSAPERPSAAMARRSRSTGRVRWRAWSSRVMAMRCLASASKSSRRLIPFLMRAGREAARRHPRAGPGPGPGRSRACADLGRRLGTAGLPAPGLTLEDKQAVNRALLAVRRADRRDELRAQAPLGDQGRPARGGRRSGADRDADHLRCAGRRPVRDRVGADRRRSDDLRRCAGRSSAATASTEPRRSSQHLDGPPRRHRSRATRAWRASRRHDRDAADVARGGGRRRASSRRDAAHSGRRDRGGGAGGRQGDGRHRARRSRCTASPRPPRACSSPAARRR